MQLSPQDLGTWEMVKGGMLTLITSGVVVIVTILFSLRDLVREHERDINGKDGKNGLKRAFTAMMEIVDQLKNRNMVLDELKKRDLERHGGEERRLTERRLTDILAKLDAETPKPERDP